MTFPLVGDEYLAKRIASIGASVRLLDCHAML